MSLRGKQSTAHEYNAQGACKYCGTYKVNVDKMSLVCTPEREMEQDRIFAKKENDRGK